MGATKNFAKPIEDACRAKADTLSSVIERESSPLESIAERVEIFLALLVSFHFHEIDRYF
jgi:hypothetical protein